MKSKTTILILLLIGIIALFTMQIYAQEKTKHEIAFLEGLSKWMDIHGEAIFGTRPWKIFGEGPTKVEAGMFIV